MPNESFESLESPEAHSKFIAFESQEFLRAWENNNFMAKKHLLTSI